MRPKDEEIALILAEFDRSGWTDMDVRLGAFRLTLSTRKDADVGAPFAREAPVPPAAPAPAQADVRAPAAPAPTPAEAKTGTLAVRAPNLGRFWRRPKPSEPPFTDVGAVIAPGDVVCIIEVMKLFTQVKAAVGGRVVACPVEDGAMVEFDDVLFWLEPA